MPKTQIIVSTENLHNGSQYIQVHNAQGKVVGVIRIALLHLGVDGKNFVEIRTEVPSGSSQLRSELK